MDTKVLLKISCQSDFNKYNGSYDGVYFINPLNYYCNVEDKEVFFDVRSLTPIDALEFSKTAPFNSTFVVDSVMKATFIKSVNSSCKISFYFEAYDQTLIDFISVNNFDVTIKYTTLAPERVNKIHGVASKVNSVFVSRFDELGVLKFYNADYVTITPDIKP